MSRRGQNQLEDIGMNSSLKEVVFPLIRSAVQACLAPETIMNYLQTAQNLGASQILADIRFCSRRYVCKILIIFRQHID